MSGSSEVIDLSKPLPEEEKKKKDELGPLAKASDVFGKFGRTRKVSVLRMIGILFSMVSGTVYPIMAFYFARSFEDLGGQPGSDSGDDYMGQVRELVFVFMIIGYVLRFTV